jgi:UMF1 family MFS transporter
MGRVSGWGWGLGYVGGMLTLGVCLAYVLSAQARGETAAQFVPVTMLITAAVYGLAACVTFVWLRERAAPVPASTIAARPSVWAQLRLTWRDSRDFPDYRQLLVCTVAYQAGVAVAITLAAIYAEQVMGFEPQETMVLIFVLNIAAFGGALAFGHLQDRWGHQRTLGLTLLGWVVVCAVAALAQSKSVFWVAAALAGLCLGSSQSAGRAMAGLLVPEHRLAEFFGLWSMAVRLASILGPVGYGLVTWITDGNQRLAIAATAGLFVLGWFLLRPIDMVRGQRCAQMAGLAKAQ